MSNETRACTHKRVRHEHGTPTAYVLDKCRCVRCRAAACSSERARYKAKAFGRYDSGRVDAQPVREHLLMLKEYGMGIKRVAQLAGVSNATLGKVIYGDPSRNVKPRARVQRHVHERVLSVRATAENLGGGVLVDGLGTRRRLQALVYIGYSQSYLGRRLGVTVSNLAKIIMDPDRPGSRALVRAETERQVKALFLKLENHPRVGHDALTRNSVSRARNYARAAGWLPPAAWDEDLMDDPKHTGYPAAVAS